jgi:hypothetical protein
LDDNHATCSEARRRGRDDDFDSTPLTWAWFMRRELVVARLEGQNAPE